MNRKDFRKYGYEVIDWIADVAGTKIPYPDSCNLEPDPFHDDLIVAPGKAVLLQVGKLGWMLVHSNSRMPDDA